MASMRNVMDISNGIQPTNRGDTSESLDSSLNQAGEELGEGPRTSSNLLSRGFMLSEEVFYWSCLCRYLYRKGAAAQDELDKLLPTLSEFADYVHRYKNFSLTMCHWLPVHASMAGYSRSCFVF